MKKDLIEMEFNNLTATFKLNCDVECGHPDVFVYSWIRTSDPDTVLHTGPEYELSVQALVSEPLLDQDTIELACKVTNTVNQNDKPNTPGSRTLFKLKFNNQTEGSCPFFSFRLYLEASRRRKKRTPKTLGLLLTLSTIELEDEIY